MCADSKTYADRVGVRVDAVNDELIERTLESDFLLWLAVLVVKAVAVQRGQDGGLGRGDELVKRLGGRFRAAVAVRGQDALRHRRRRLGAGQRGVGGGDGGRGRAEDGHVRRGAEEADDGRVPVVQLGHRVEQVSDQAGTAHDGGGGHVGRGHTVADGEGDAALDDFLHCGADAGDFGGSGDDTDSSAVSIFRREEPVLLDGEVLSTVNLLDGLEALVGLEEELRSVGAALGELDEGALCVPSEDCGGVGGRVRAQKVEKHRIERPLLGLKRQR